MHAARRSRLSHIALVALSVLLSHTAYASKPARALTPGTPVPHIKLSSAQPEQQKKFALAIRKLQNPRPTQRIASTPSFLLAHTSAELTFAAQQRIAARAYAQSADMAPQRLPHILRI